MSYILLELDTTPPEIEIYAPRYTTREIENIITIQSSDKLSSHQEIYVIDSNGKRFDYSFSHKVNTLNGKVKFNEMSLGIVTLYIRVQDEVDNMSKLYQYNIELKENVSRLRMDISHGIRPLFVFTTIRDITINDLHRKISIVDSSREITINDSSREVIINIEV